MTFTPSQPVPRPVRKQMEWAGFRPLRQGRIHVYCPKCGRKMSNMARDKDDPPRATLVHVFCVRCSQGCKDVPMYFFAASGKRLREAWEC